MRGEVQALQRVNVQRQQHDAVRLPVVPDPRGPAGEGLSLGVHRQEVGDTLRGELEEFTPRIEHVRLELDPDFFNLFVGGMGFQVEPPEKND